MRGLYINCDNSKLRLSSQLASVYSKQIVLPEQYGNGMLIYNPQEWHNAPMLSLGSNHFVLSGWFIYKNQRNNLSLLASDLVDCGYEVLRHITSGSFVLLWVSPDEKTVIVDPFGLSTHFIDTQSDRITVAPSVKVLYKESVHTLNDTLNSILGKKHHLFGNYTLYNGIERLSPGSYKQESTKEACFYYSFETELEPIALLGGKVQKLVENWPYDSRILPLSSGLDSRFLLANGRFKSGFTYGPENSPEINIAGHFRACFSQYKSFDYSEQPLHDDEPAILDELSFGILTPIPRLLTNYIYAKELFPQSNAFFDGYLGDVLQRGTYVGFKGKLGELFKIFPFIYRLYPFSAKRILQWRYKELSALEFDLVYADFLKWTESLKLNDLQKVTYYEFLFGRGGRYTIFGSNVLAAQLFTVVSPFADISVFNSLINHDFKNALSYKTMHQLWSKVAKKYSEVKVESGYTPRSNRFLIPIVQITYRMMFHFIPSRANYGVKLSRDIKKGE
ncbi:hypothetical protein PULV_a3407 [Pseudoalteromonas ulvae UL12]|uniref:hypothetical protein n=1 Tax=Pseudoalteromonas ulvae TaxID=107327 RepID=UPI00186BAAE6|nr:hypothetical protein [Pseudoalteromonas ulvae]MBE0365094.1 hypothetical protein [Pseudoalteromonas ulvae UL12]